MTETLDLSAFPRFFEEVHGDSPFPWQMKLAELVFRDGWPSAIDAPTGSGKTSAIDVAVFHLACQIDAEAPARRTAPAKILFVIDRRIVVDDVYEHAQRLASAIADGRGPITRLVADRLGLLAEAGKRPLEVVRLRGGVPKEPDWVRTPTQPIVVVSTVDQVGSRLLFRGYGVRPRMWPVHAGLLGSDSLLLLDEAHLSQPFLKTVRTLCRQQESIARAPDRIPAPPLGVVTLSATQIEEAPRLLSDDDRRHPELGPRLSASKPTRLELLRCKADSTEHIDAIVDRACVLASGDGDRRPQATAVVVNRVRRARQVFEAIRLRMSDADVVLLIGRSRPLERDRLVDEIRPRIHARRERDETESATNRPLIVVATQCIEVGADLDFDALLTEIAPIDSLRQRFGRLDRMGRCAPSARAIIVATPDQVGTRSAKDPVYGDACKKTWDWLREHAETTQGKVKVLKIDFGTMAAAAWLPKTPDELSPLLAPRADAPMLQPAFVERWARTSPLPTDEPDVSLFLHGPNSSADVQIVWRADLERPARPIWAEQVAACPPSSLEAVSVPLWEARRWLQNVERRPQGFELHPQIDDLALSPEPTMERHRLQGRDVRALRWEGTVETSELVSAAEIRPGDVLVVPATDGGCDRWGWNPSSRTHVADLGLEANRDHRGIEFLRLSPRLLEHDLLREQAETPFDVDYDRLRRTRQDVAEKARGAAARLEACLAELVDATETEAIERLRELTILPEAWKRVLESDRRLRLLRIENAGEGSRPNGYPLAIVRRKVGAAGEATTEDDESSRRSLRSVYLSDHSRGVSELARSYARLCGLPEPLIEDVALAAFLHDAGKAHRAFKLWLYGGDELAASGPPLAKSGRRFLPARARELAHLPPDARHEIASVAFAEAHPKLREAHDPELVLWLVGTHHGWGRPFFPGVEWPPGGDHFEADLGDGTVRATVRPLSEFTASWLAMTHALMRRYGPWGLARLEANVRLADHRRSQLEQEEGEPITGESGQEGDA